MPELAPQDGFTRLHNPSTGDPWNCPDAAVEDWESRGWSRTPKADPTADKPKDVSRNG